MQNTKIEWTRHTANLWWGCHKVHAGCDHCYAEAQDNRWAPARGSHWGPHAPRMAVKGVWKDLEKYQMLAAAAGEVHSIFVGSMMDIFEKPFPLVNAKGDAIPDPDLRGDLLYTGDLRRRLFDDISAGKYPNLLFLLLTKRPGNILKYIPEAWKTNPPANVMYGTSIVDQETADRYIPELLQVPGRRFLSMEPLLGPVKILHHLMGGKDPGHCGNCGQGHGFTRCPNYGGTAKICTPDPVNDPWGPKKMCSDFKRVHFAIDWVIVGGESGHHARPMHPGWARSLRDQCTAASVPFFFKQWGEWENIEWVDATHSLLLDGTLHPDKPWGNPGKPDKRAFMRRVGKKASGRMLDGQEWSQYPAPVEAGDQ